MLHIMFVYCFTLSQLWIPIQADLFLCPSFGLSLHQASQHRTSRLRLENTGHSTHVTSVASSVRRAAEVKPHYWALELVDFRRRRDGPGRSSWRRSRPGWNELLSSTGITHDHHHCTVTAGRSSTVSHGAEPGPTFFFSTGVVEESSCSRDRWGLFFFCLGHRSTDTSCGWPVATPEKKNHIYLNIIK